MLAAAAAAGAAPALADAGQVRALSTDSVAAAAAAAVISDLPAELRLACKHGSAATRVHPAEQKPANARSTPQAEVVMQPAVQAF